MNLKTPKNRSDRIRQSARMEDCTVRSAQCNFNPETTIYAHLPLDGGIATKPDDLSGCYACSSCHDLIDRRSRCEEFERGRDKFLRIANIRTIIKLHNKGILTIEPDESEETIVNAEQNHVHTQLCEAASALHKAETATKDESIKQKCYEVGLHVARLIRDFDGTTSHA